MVQSYPPVQVMMPLPITTYEAPSGIPKTTEYRSQFIWLPSSADTATTPAAAAATTHYDATPKKSISMGAIQGAPVGPPGAAQPTPAAVKSQDGKYIYSVFLI